MMTQEQKNELAGLCRIEIRRWKHAAEAVPDKRYMVELMEMALAALTQPASPALKLPDVPPNALVALCEQMYDHRSTGATVAHDVWQVCIEELLMDAPHTAPIEPICATGGTEWVKPIPRELQQVLLELRTYDPKADDYGGKHIIPGWAVRIEKALGIKPAGSEEE